MTQRRGRSSQKRIVRTLVIGLSCLAVPAIFLGLLDYWGSGTKYLFLALLVVAPIVFGWAGAVSARHGFVEWGIVTGGLLVGVALLQVSLYQQIVWYALALYAVIGAAVGGLAWWVGEQHVSGDATESDIASREGDSDAPK